MIDNAYKKARLAQSADDPNTTYLMVAGGGSLRLVFRDGVYVGWYDSELSEVLY